MANFHDAKLLFRIMKISHKVVPGTGIEPVWLAPRDFLHTTVFTANFLQIFCLCAGLCLHHDASNAIKRYETSQVLPV